MRKPKPTEAEIMAEVATASPLPRRVHVFGSVEIVEPEGDQTMKIKLMKNWTGAVDGIHPVTYAAGTEQDFPEAIAVDLLKDGRAVLVHVETKALAGAPENKMEPGPKQNKVGVFHKKRK
jgi:hypothetical protein